MSRVGKLPIKLNTNIKVSVTENASRFNGQLVVVEGPKGKLDVHVRPEVSIKVAESEVVVDKGKSADKKTVNAYHGLYRTLIANAVNGVSVGYEKELEIVGIGYKADKSGNNLRINIGFTNPVEFPIPTGINIDVKDGIDIKVSGIDKQLVGEVAAQIRKIRKPEPYKGKGIRYKGEQIKLKAGKSAS